LLLPVLHGLRARHAAAVCSACPSIGSREAQPAAHPGQSGIPPRGAALFRAHPAQHGHDAGARPRAVVGAVAGPHAWTFKLRPNLVFHDGTPCTSADVIASFEAMLDPKTASPARNNIGPIEGVTASDGATVLFKLKAPYAPCTRRPSPFHLDGGPSLPQSRFRPASV
jgi:Bacterial extracellular solute-binding proteins, family 5 Middle